LLLVAIFLAFRVSDALMLFAAGPYNNSQLVGSIITTGIWTTALLVAIAYRKNWARYFLIILLIIAVVGTFIILPELLKVEITSPVLFTVLCLTTVLNAGIAWCLISAPSIRHLTNRSHE
jgi:lipoprotein signal peptidase